MEYNDKIKELLNDASLSKLDKLLLCLSAIGGINVQVKDIRAAGINLGLRSIKKWNVSSILSSKYAIRSNKGWELSVPGKNKIQELLGSSTGFLEISHSLREHLTFIQDSEITTFLNEAISCYESKYYRAAVVLSWVGAISILSKYIVDNRLSDFNIEAFRRNPKWKNALTSDDLSLMKESEFLDILESLSVIGKDVKVQLKECLNLRNSCGHPNSLKISENSVSAHIEKLILNVYDPFID